MDIETIVMESDVSCANSIFWVKYPLNSLHYYIQGVGWIWVNIETIVMGSDVVVSDTQNSMQNVREPGANMLFHGIICLLVQFL